MLKGLALSQLALRADFGMRWREEGLVVRVAGLVLVLLEELIDAGAAVAFGLSLR